MARTQKTHIIMLNIMVWPYTRHTTRATEVRRPQSTRFMVRRETHMECMLLTLLVLVVEMRLTEYCSPWFSCEL